MLHPTPSNRLTFASLPHDLHDDATCTTRCRSSTNFKAKLENPSLTCFMTKQVTGCRHVSSHHLHPLIGLEAQTDKTSSHLVLRPKSRNYCGNFEAQITKPSTLVLRPKPRSCHIGFEAKSLTKRRHRF
jgi:hypothetical protein